MQDSSGFPKGKVLYRFTTRPEEDVTGRDDMPAEYVVIENRQAQGGLVVYGLHPRTGEWIVNWQERHVVRRLLEDMARLRGRSDDETTMPV